MSRHIIALVLILGACTAGASPSWADAAGTEQFTSTAQENDDTERATEHPQSEEHRDLVSERKRREADRMMQHLNDAALRVGTGEDDRIPWLRLR